MRSTSTTAETNSWVVPVETASGVFSAEFTERGLARLAFPRGGPRGRLQGVEGMPREVRGWCAMTRRALQAALKGAALVSLPPLDWSGATSFQCRVWNDLLRIQPGHTASYGQVARRIKQPNAARAVGTACGANPVPVLVPCHRVLTADGRLGGFSGGLDWKRRLLAAEGAAVTGEQPSDPASTRDTVGFRGMSCS